jgi:selenocysteine lyase/cysteine desulfurase
MVSGARTTPPQSNFSGVLHPLSLVSRAQALGYQVLLELAAYVPTKPFSLRRCPADLTTLSFYKIFG